MLGLNVFDLLGAALLASFVLFYFTNGFVEALLRKGYTLLRLHGYVLVFFFFRYDCLGICYNETACGFLCCWLCFKRQGCRLHNPSTIVVYI